MTFLKVIIIAIGIYYLLKLLVRIIFPFWMQKTFDKMNNESQSQQKRKEGEVIIDKKPDNKANPNKKNIGDYVDFEDVD